MIHPFNNYITANELFVKDDLIILAISGGIDSVVMLDLFNHAGYNYIIVHCNFKLRGEESDLDEEFVKELGEKYNVAVHIKHFDTEEYAESRNISIQMAARELRYEWFEELRIDTGAKYIATAHNKNDVAETFFINLLRGTGIKGLTGINPKTGNVVRPLLWAERKDIYHYTREHDIDWREDSSNATLKYSRNKIRHQIVPLMEEINPGFISIMEKNIENLKAAEEIYSRHIDEVKNTLLVREKNYSWIRIDKILEKEPVNTWLFEIISEFDFSAAVTADILKSLNGIPGKIFYSPTHRAIKDRDKLLIEPLQNTQQRKYYIEEANARINEPLKLTFSIITDTKNYQISKTPFRACLDYDKLNFPLIIRKWEQGDYFCPLGMKNLKKVSDYFIDIKLSIPEKERAWILASGKNIVWIIGYRIDERYKITENTKQALEIECLSCQ